MAALKANGGGRSRVKVDILTIKSLFAKIKKYLSVLEIFSVEIAWAIAVPINFSFENIANIE